MSFSPVFTPLLGAMEEDMQHADPREVVAHNADRARGGKRFLQSHTVEHRPEKNGNTIKMS